MGDFTFLFVEDLTFTVPKLFVHEDMRDKFEAIVNAVNITDRLPIDEFKQPPENQLFVPIAYNLIIDALANPDLLKRLKEIAEGTGYWFFNAFLVAPEFDIPSPSRSASPLDEVVSTLRIPRVIKGPTTGVEQNNPN